MAEQAKLAESNLANYGGKDHRNAAKKAAQSEAQYAGAGEKPGLEIWRVENRRTDGDKPNFGVNKWPKEQYGEFFDGDSYIILNTFKAKDPLTGKTTDKLAWDLHFWLGQDSTQDEIGVAAYKTVELDDLLDDGPVQHREVMGNESQLFQTYFKQGIQYLSGGIASGFRHVKEDEYVPRLLEVRRTKKTTRARQVECSIKSMNTGDCYILDLGKKVYKYLGPEASPFEKSSCANLAANIVSGRQGKAKEVNITDDDDFWKTVGGSAKEVESAWTTEEKKAQESAADQSFERKDVKIFRISDNGGSKVTFKAVDPADSKGYTNAQLDSGDVFIVDSGIEIFIWVGEAASKAEKGSAWKLVDKYMADHGRPSSTPVSLINEGKINIVFKSCFAF